MDVRVSPPEGDEKGKVGAEGGGGGEVVVVFTREGIR